MKKIALCLLSFHVTAAPIGNPSAPKIIQEGFFIPSTSWASARFGYEGDFVADSRMEQEGAGHSRVDSYEQETNSGTATLCLLNQVDIFTVLGSSRTRTDWRFVDGGGSTHRAELETLYNFLWGVGARAILWSCGNASFGVGGRYESANYDPVWLTIDGNIQSASGTHLRWREWQINGDLSYKIDIFSPYIGAKYSNVRSKIGNFSVAISNDGSGSNEFENRTSVGVFIGCSLSTGKYFMLNVEGRLIDEEAVTISGDLRF